MLKIKKIEFLKVVYDESLSHNIFSIANITFSNAAPILGALLYWRKNTSKSEYTPEGDYKFFYDMANVMFFASVKFPTHTKLTRDQRQELAFILLEQRGSVGSYSFSTSLQHKKTFRPKQHFDSLTIPAHFNKEDFSDFAYFEKTATINEELLDRFTTYNRTFVKDYLKWRYKTAILHPSDIKHYLPYISFSYLCYINPYLTEAYLIDHLQEVDFMALQFNRPVLARLSSSFKRFMVEQIQLQKKTLHDDFIDQLEDFIEDDFFYGDDDFMYLSESDEHDDMEFAYFEYDLGPNKWSGSEHLVRAGIPSYACRMYDRYGFKKPTNKEMDAKFKTYNVEQIELFSAIADLHWLHKYRNNVNWQHACQFNGNLTEQFLTAHINFVDFKALGQNTFAP